MWLEDDGVHGAVRGSDGTTWYHVNASCSCEDAQFRAFQHLCKHRLAVGLLRRASELMHQGAPVPDAAQPLALGEAPPPASIVTSPWLAAPSR